MKQTFNPYNFETARSWFPYPNDIVNTRVKSISVLEDLDFTTWGQICYRNFVQNLGDLI